MKKSIILTTVILIIVFNLMGCSLFVEMRIAPPNWIIGTWVTEDFTDSSSGKTIRNQYTFTKDNIIFSSGEVILDYKARFKYATMTVNDVSNTEYDFTVDENDSSGSVTNEQFVKISDTILHYRNAEMHSSDDPVTFTKQ